MQGGSIPPSKTLHLDQAMIKDFAELPIKDLKDMKDDAVITAEQLKIILAYKSKNSSLSSSRPTDDWRTKKVSYHLQGPLPSRLSQEQTLSPWDRQMQLRQNARDKTQKPGMFSQSQTYGFTTRMHRGMEIQMVPGSFPDLSARFLFREREDFYRTQMHWFRYCLTSLSENDILVEEEEFSILQSDDEFEEYCKNSDSIVVNKIYPGFDSAKTGQKIFMHQLDSWHEFLK